MAYIKSFLSNKVFWTLFVAFLIGGFHAITGMIPTGYVEICETLLGILATHFHVQTVAAIKAAK